MVKSLRKTLLLWLLAPLLILFSLGTVIVYQLALNYSEDAYDRALFESAHDIEQLARESINKTGRLELPNMARDILLADRYDKTYFSILDQANTLIAGDGKLAAPPDDADRDDDGSITYDTVIEDEDVRAIRTELHLEIAGQPRIWQILVGETRHKRNGLAKDILTGFVVPQALVIMAAAILVMLGVRRGLTPLEDLRASLAKRSHNDMRPLDTPGVPVEVRPLLEEINNLLSRLQSVLEAQKRFTADAAHQLRTPLAGLSAQTDFAREQPNPPQTQHALDQIKEVSTRLNHAVSQLLSLARNEPGAGKSLRLESIDLNTLARETTLEWVERAVERGIDLGFEGSDTAVSISGDASRLKEMLDNLVDNALCYCPRGSSVTVRVGSNRTLCVEDNGPGIPEEDRDKVFERFHRLLGNEAEGNGLGLAIVREIAEMHGGTVQVTEGTNGRGALFRVCFPATNSI